MSGDIPWTNSATAAIASGAIVAIRTGTTGQCGIAVNDIAGSGGTGELAVEGVFRLSKASGAISRGALVYRNSSGTVTATSTSNTLIGYALASATTAATTVDVDLD